MRAGRIRRNARRGVLALVLGWVAVMVGSLLMAPSASAAPTATVYIRDLTPPLVSVDKNGVVTFINQIQDKSVQVGGGGLVPTLVTATVHTDVTLQLPSGKYTLHSQDPNDPNPENGSSVAEKFGQSCVTCTITYTYAVSLPPSVVGSLVNTLTSQALAQLPQSQVVTYNGQQTTVTIGLPTPFIVNTLLPLPNLPSVNLPSHVQVTVPAPGGVGVPNLGGTVGGLTGTVTTTTTTTATTATGIDGAQYQYLSGLGAPQMSPAGRAASSAIEQVRTVTGPAAGGPGGQQGAYDTTPVFALDGTKLKNADASSPLNRPQNPPLSLPALLAVVLLVAAVAGLVMVQRARRAAERDR